jgi:hypothetical protein
VAQAAAAKQERIKGAPPHPTPHRLRRTTMVARGTDGIYRTEAHESHAPVVATDDAPDWSGWQKWLDGHLAIEREETNKCIGWVLSELRHQIRELEGRLAEARGAIDVLRGKGAPGALRVTGTFIPDGLYLANDVVACNGSSFVALRDRPGPCPGDGWQLLASAGKRGPRGERGLQGPRGPTSEWRHLSFDPEKLAFRISLSDGSPGPTIFLRSIFSGISIDRETYELVLRTVEGREIRFSLHGLFQEYDDQKRGY